MDQWSEFEAEYQDRVSDVSSANSSTYEQKLRDFIDLLDEAELSKEAVRAIEFKDFAAWYCESDDAAGRLAGGDQLDWARDRTVRLGQQLALFRYFTKNPHGYSDFSINYMYVSARYDDMVFEINHQLFNPFSRDLLKHIRKYASQTSASRSAPASDRVVAINHNESAYRDANSNLTLLEQAAQTSNHLAVHAPEERDRVVAELGAVKRLLMAVRVRVDILAALVLPALKWLGQQIRDTSVQIAITAVIASLATLLKITLPGL